ncbi:unnamed protein product [Phytomonas sp. EM1]|nr:unnamed protein product [Phytomonas sp. EM1]|eukprot:CCW62802.1 unnamed protein product [Phytomonas sp. isolate EM1]
MAAHPVTKFLFDRLIQEPALDLFIHDGLSTDKTPDQALTSLGGGEKMQPSGGAQTFILVLDDRKRLEDAIAAVSCGSLDFNPLERLLRPSTAPTVLLYSPDDWESGEILMEIPGPKNNTEIVTLRFFDRSFLELLYLPVSSVKPNEVSEADAVVSVEKMDNLTVDHVDSKGLLSTNRIASPSDSCFCEVSPLVGSANGRVYYYISSDESVSDG